MSYQPIKLIHMHYNKGPPPPLSPNEKKAQATLITLEFQYPSFREAIKASSSVILSKSNYSEIALAPETDTNHPLFILFLPPIE